MIFGAYLITIGILLGTGTLMATVLPTRGARIGLGAVLFLALLVDLSWVLAPLVGWQARLIDGVWGGVFAVIVLAAAMLASYHQGIRGQRAWRWPSHRDAAFLLVVIAFFGALIVVLPVPLDTDAQGFGYLALTLRNGEDFTSLAPWHGEVQYLYAPAYTGLVAHLSARFALGLHELMMIWGALTGVLFVWAAYDLGCELGDARMGRAYMLAALVGTGLLTAFMDSHYTALLALSFALVFLAFALRYLREGRALDALFAAASLAAVPLSQPDMTLALIVGYVPWLLVLPLAVPSPTWRRWGGLAVFIPALALLITLPWLWSIRDLLGAEIESPFTVSSEHWRTMIVMHGGAIVVLSTLGAMLDLWRRKPEALLAAVWLVAIVEFSTLGLLEKMAPAALAFLWKYDYPFSIAWHGPIIPYVILGGTAFAWLAQTLHLERVVRALAYPLSVLALLSIGAFVFYFDDLLRASKETSLGIYGAFSSAADVEAMQWLRDHTPADARVLNHPGPYEADWAPVISERDTVYFRPQPFFRHTEAVQAEQDTLRAFWRTPQTRAHWARLVNAGVDYVLVPQVFGNPGALAEMLRWRPPLPEAASYAADTLGDVPYLRLVYERDGAQVYEVVRP